MGAPARRDPPLSEERELKIPVGALESVRERLGEAGAIRIHRTGLERNWVWDRGTTETGDGGEGELRSTRRLLRLREDPTGVTLTYKGPPRWGGGGAKVREEIELSLAARAPAHALLRALGYRVVRRYEKERERWALEAAEIALDRTPLGDFVEIEANREHADLAQVARSLGLDPVSAERRSYLALWEAHRRRHGEVGPDMTFDRERW